MRVASTHIHHLQTFQGLLEAVKVAFGGSSDNSNGGKAVTTNDAALSILSGLGRG